MAVTIELAENDIRDAFAPIVFDRPVSRIVSGAKRRLHRRRLVMGAAPALALVGAGGTALLTADETGAGNVYCYYSADAKDLPLGAHGPSTTGESPEELCAKEWSAGYYPFQKAAGDGTWTVPPLTACAVETGAIGVFPTDEEDFCTKGPVAREMGLSEVPPGYDEHVERFVGMRADITQRIRGAAVAEGGSEAKACLGEGSATALVAEVLADHGYGGWTVEVSHSKTDAPCWTHVDFDSIAREVVIYSTEPGVANIWIDGGAAFPQE